MNIQVKEKKGNSTLVYTVVDKIIRTEFFFKC